MSKFKRTKWDTVQRSILSRCMSRRRREERHTPCTYDIHVAAVTVGMSCVSMCDVCMQCMHAIVDRADQGWLWAGERRDCDGWNSEKRDMPTCEVNFPGQGSYCH